MQQLTNLHACHFAPLTEIGPLRGRLLELCKGWHLRGTLLLAPEGMNLWISGPMQSIDALLAELRSLPGFETLAAKLTPTQHQPSARLRVSIQRNLTTLETTGIPPEHRATPLIPAQNLRGWLDLDAPVVLLDLRNEREASTGAFRKGRTVNASHFRDLPAALRRLPPTLRDQLLMLVCRDGSRCAQAAPFLQHQGFQHVFRLEGGMDRYREVCGQAHLHEHQPEREGPQTSSSTEDDLTSQLCFACEAPLRPEDLSDSRYVVGRSCPQCFRTAIQETATSIEARHELIRAATHPLPGSQPRDCFKSITVRPHCDGKTVMAALRSAVGHLPESYWAKECAEHRILTVRHEPVTANAPVREGQIYLHKFPNATEPEINADVRILHEDEALIVINKPAPLPMHAGGRFFRNTLQHILNAAYAPEQPRPAHRLDANTTGVILITRSQLFAGRLQPQFSEGRIQKQYLVRVQGQPPQDSFYCNAPIGSDSRELGSRRVDFEAGLHARTEFRVLRRDPDGTALLEANPLTGRTNQIRVHLWHLGFPVCGDPVYLADGSLGNTQTLHTEAPPLNLHSWRIRFEHPLDGRPTEFTAPPPAWARSEID